MIVHPKFYKMHEPDELKIIRAQLDFRTKAFTALVCFGGVPPTLSTRKLIIALAKKGINTIVLCGKNNALLDYLHKLKVRVPILNDVANEHELNLSLFSSNIRSCVSSSKISLVTSRCSCN